MTRKKPQLLVTIIIPAYNRVFYLEETIKSVLSQDYPNIEYIVLDDGSTDDSIEVIKKFKNKIIWDSHKNMGEANTVNKGFKMAHGEIIGIINSDDPLLPNAISEIVKFMQNNPEIIVVYPDWKKIDSEGKVIEYVKTLEYDYEYMLKKHHCVPGPGTFFRRSVIKAIRGRDPQFKYVSDFDFWLRAGLIGQFARLPKILATFRIHQDSASVKQQGYMMSKEHIDLVNKFFTLPSIPLHFYKYKSEAYCYAYLVASDTSGANIFLKLRYLMIAFYFSPYLFFKKNFVKLTLKLLKIISFQ